MSFVSICLNHVYSMDWDSFAGFGSACHLGVLADLPTIGIGKNVSNWFTVSLLCTPCIFSAEKKKNFCALFLNSDFSRARPCLYTMTVTYMCLGGLRCGSLKAYSACSVSGRAWLVKGSSLIKMVHKSLVMDQNVSHKHFLKKCLHL